MKSIKISILSRRPALVSLLCLVAGILFSNIVNVNYLYSLLFTFAVLLITLYLYLKGSYKASGLLLILLIFSIGWFRTSVSNDTDAPNHISNLARQAGRVEIIGRIESEPDIRENFVYLIVEADTITISRNKIPTFGKIRVKVYNTSGFDYADIIHAEGYIYKPSGPRNPGGFDYGGYLRTKMIFAAMTVSGPGNIIILNKEKTFLSNVVSPVRDHIISTSKKYLSSEASAILTGFIIGERREISKEYQQKFQDTGTLHLMAVSGSNVGMVLAIFALPLTLLGSPRRVKVIILLIIIWFFAILTRMEPSVIRASIMASVGLISYGWQRKPDYINLLAFAGLIMLLWRPLQLYDVGLQLSFAATFGIIFTMPPLFSYLMSRFKISGLWLRWFIALPISTFAAQIAVLPLMSRYFNQFPLVGFIANIPIGIMSGLATSGGVALYIASIINGWVAKLVAIPLQEIIEIIFWLLNLFSSFSKSVIKVASMSWWEAILYWITAYVVFEILFQRRFSKTAIVSGLLIANIIIWQSLLYNEKSIIIEYLDLDKSRVAFFTTNDGNIVGCVDVFNSDYAPARTVIPHILNNYDGRLDYLITKTPESDDIAEIMDQFSPNLVTLDSLKQIENTHNYELHKKINLLPSGVKVVWDQSDNNDEGINEIPILQVNTGDDILIIAPWEGSKNLNGIQINNQISILELPWSDYSKSSCKKLINDLDPRLVVFSPDQYTVRTPRNPFELTHSMDKIVVASICGGFAIERSGQELGIQSMKPVFDQENIK